TDAKEEETAIGVGAITLFGTLVMFVFPFVGQLLGLSPEAFGLWAGAAIHEVAQVIAAGFAFDAASSTGSSIELATVVKLGRVLMLAPVAVVLAHTHRASRAAGAAKVSPIPWFVALFIATMLLRSTGVLPMEVVDQAIRFDGILLAVSMAGLGLDLRWAKVKAAGVAPLYAVLLGTLFIGLSTLALVTLLTCSPPSPERGRRVRAHSPTSRGTLLMRFSLSLLGALALSLLIGACARTQHRPEPPIAEKSGPEQVTVLFVADLH